jgi:hypothetical protein
MRPIAGYSQQYGYNVRGRNDRNVEHLMITNYPLSSGTAKDMAAAA